ncbi:hypothetical protein GGX14DRAFT_696950 [Mycena pura]|uniref:Uncharacterized protein n=1 Tax=Mycena pura TaxID=153505 RepID=A0AAD6VHF2_9AGAR|nr:hypothetical protein GGX14DRAFT_696950 [Mycena pura]
MSSFNESLAVAASAPTNTPVQTMLAMLVLGVTGTMYYASPSRLTRVMVAAIAHAEKMYIDALESGALSATDVHIDDIAEKMSSLHTKVSEIRETTLRNSLSHRAAFRQYLTGHAFALVQCIWEVHDFQTRIEILKEAQLRDIYASSTAIRGVSLRRRRNPS